MSAASSLQRPAPGGDPRRDCAIYACDARHLPFAWAAATRLAEAEGIDAPGAGPFDIAIATPDPGAIPDACWDGPVQPVRLDVAALPPIRHPNPRITLGTFYRHLLPALLRPRYRQLLYMDTDTWMVRPGAAGLFARAGGAVMLAAVPAFRHEPILSGGRERMKPRYARILDELGGTRGRFFQAGVLLIGTDLHAEAGIGPAVLDWAARNEGTMRRHHLGDQAAMNAVCADRITVLDPRWNWHNRSWLTEGADRAFEPHLLHFTGAAKPWATGVDGFVASFHGDWASRLRAAAAGWAPAPAEGTLEHLAAHPRFGVPPLDAAWLRWRRHREGRKAGRRGHDGTGTAAARMRALIGTAELG